MSGGLGQHIVLEYVGYRASLPESNEHFHESFMPKGNHIVSWRRCVYYKQITSNPIGPGRVLLYWYG